MESCAFFSPFKNTRNMQPLRICVHLGSSAADFEPFQLTFNTNPAVKTYINFNNQIQPICTTSMKYARIFLFLKR